MKICADAQAAARLLKFRAAEQFADKFSHQRHPRLAADQNDLIQIFGFQFRVRQRAQTMRARAGNDVARQIFQFCARQFATEGKIRREKWQRDFHFRFRGQFDFRLLSRFADSRKNGRIPVKATGCKPVAFVHLIEADRLEACPTCNFLHQKIHEPFVQIIAAQPRVAVRGQHLKHAFVQFQNRKVERAAAQIIHGDF